MTELPTVHRQYMMRCIQLARLAEGATYPNPLVGCVIVHRGVIVGEGYHRKAGEPHAEVNAICSVKDQAVLSECTLYVNLEPCSHFGRTPPCALLLIEKKIPRVVIGCTDTFSEVSGRGIATLCRSGVEVLVGVCEAESRWLNRRFFTFQEKQRPYVVLKWAQSADGYLDGVRTAGDGRQPEWFTHPWCRIRVHRQRTKEQAICVGSATARFDNPLLTARNWYGNQPIRVVVDRMLQLPSDLKLFTDGGPTLVLNLQRHTESGTVQYLQFSQPDGVEGILRQLHQRGIQSVIVEGGAQLLTLFVEANLWDEAEVYMGNTLLREGVKAPVLPAPFNGMEWCGDTRLYTYRNLEWATISDSGGID